MRPQQTAQTVWAIAIGLLLGYEVWALVQGYEWTLTAGAREVFEAYPWTMGIVAGILAWLVVHLMIEKRNPK